MLSKQYRLKNEKDIKLVLSKGGSIFDKVCGIKFKANKFESPRFAFVAGIKTHKSAVQRNRVKRQYRAIVKDLIPLIDSVDVVLLIGADAVTLSFQEKQIRLIKVFKKAGLIS